MTREITSNKKSREYGLRIPAKHNLHRIEDPRGPKLRIMKFGGTSVGDSCCFAKVIEIVRAASREDQIIVVVSAIAGVTNKLIEAALQAESGNMGAVRVIFQDLRKQHETVMGALIGSETERDQIRRKMDDLFQEADRLCQGTVLLRELTLRTRDAISSLGERLSAPLLAAALSERGVVSESIEASELIVTDSYHGAADPQMGPTCDRCEERLRPVLCRGIVPVVTGFLGATADGALTTLGRGGSDYSATIVGAAMQADEIIIWTDVDGLMTADPRLVSSACTVPEVSYREATELAHFGAKVLHPKTLSAVVQSAIPVWIRNTFAPEQHGTRITPTGLTTGDGVKALAAIADAVLIRVGGDGIAKVADVLGRTFATTAAVRADVLLISQSSSQNDICLVVSSSNAKRTVEALRREFASDLLHERAEHITVDLTVAIVAVVGHNVGGMSTIVGRTFGALSEQNVNVIAIAQGSSECTISFVVAQSDVKTALLTAHTEFQLGTPNPRPLPAKSSTTDPQPRSVDPINLPMPVERTL